MDNRKIFDKVKKEAEICYKKIGEIYCPYLKKDVLFNIKGLKHIKFHQWKKARTISDQYLRFKFLKLSPEIIIKVVVKDILETSGALYFWSVIPFWKTKKDPMTGQIEKILYEGNLETQ